MAVLHRALFLCAAGAAAPASADQGPALTVPPGFEVNPAALAPLVRNPTTASFDDRGRLYVTDGQRVVTLDDADGDGRFDTASVFAENLGGPAQGVACHDGAVFVAAPPALWRLRDTDGDGAADERKELLTGFPRTGAADDLHGPSVGPDGFLYVCAGRFPHEIKDAFGNDLHKGRSPLLLRCRPDGSGAEVVGALPGNPADVAWTSAGDPIVSGSLPGDGSARDALVHAVEGGTYPVLGFTPEQYELKQTVGPLPPLVPMDAARPRGLLRYRNMTMGRPYTGTLLCAESDARRVRQHVLEQQGSTYRARTENFLESASPDFRPADVVEDADGSVLVIDAGNGPDSPGGIYRLRRQGGVRIADPRGARLNWEQPEVRELVRRLQDIRPVVSDRAVREVGRLGTAAVPYISDLMSRSLNANARLNAVRALARMEGAIPAEVMRVALIDESPLVRQAAAYLCGLRRDKEAVPRLMDLVRGDNAAIRREAATALGRIGNPAAAAMAQGSAQASATRAPQRPPGVVVEAPPGGPAAATPARVVTAPAPSHSAPATQTTTAPASQPQSAPAVASAPPGSAPPGGPPGPAPGQPAEAPPPPPPPPPPAPAVPVLLDALRGGTDRFLEHAVVYALIRINDRESTARGLQDPDSYVRRGAQLALDAMPPAEPAPRPAAPNAPSPAPAPGAQPG